MSLFSFEEVNINPSSESDEGKKSILTAKFLSFHYLAINNINELTNDLPSQDAIHFIWTLKSFNTFTFIQYIISKAGMIDDLTLSSYNVSRVVILSLMELVDGGYIANLTIIISDVAKTRFPQNFDLLNLESSKRKNVLVKYVWNHSKVATALCGDQYYVIEGSGNFADNSRHEQYIFLNNKDIYNFRKNWLINDIHG